MQKLQDDKYFEELKTLEEKLKVFIQPEKQQPKYRKRLEVAMGKKQEIEA